MVGQLVRQDDGTRFDSVAAVFAVDLSQRIVSSTPAADVILARRPQDTLPCYEVMRALDPRNANQCRPDCAEVTAARGGRIPHGSSLWEASCPVPRPITTLVQSRRSRSPVIIHVVQEHEPRVRQSPPPPSEGITARQAEALRLLANGIAPRGIAQALGVSPVTARNHIQTAMERLGAHTRLEAVMLASRAGLL